MIKDTKYRANAQMIRTGGAVTFEERPAQPSDFTAARGFPYAKEYADSPTQFQENYPTWQTFADGYSMRRYVLTISGRLTVATDQFGAAELGNYLDAGFQNIKSFAVIGSDSGSIPRGKYLMNDFRFDDRENGHTELSVSYTQYGKWELVKTDEKVVRPVKSSS